MYDSVAASGQAESFKGRIALVTGASRGIGLAIARELVKRGAKVCITARKEQPLQQAIEELGGRDVAVAVAGKADDKRLGTPEDIAGTIAFLLCRRLRMDHRPDLRSLMGAIRS